MRREVLLLAEMIEAARKAHGLVTDVALEVLAEDSLRRDALLWNFTVLGEAAAQIPEEIKDQFPELPWRQPMRLRNRIVHGYWSIDLDILYTTATTQLPEFIRELTTVLDLLRAEDVQAE